MHWFDYIVWIFLGLNFGWYLADALDKRNLWSIIRVTLCGFLYIGFIVCILQGGK